MDVSKERATNNYDFLRIFAAICITFTHSFNLVRQNAEEPMMRFSGQRYDFSFIGLCLFFSISGYLITRSACTSPSVWNYAWKRFLRIQPLLIIVCLLSVFILGPIVTKLSTGAYFSNISTWTYFRNIFPATGIQFVLPGVFENNIAEPGVNGSLWTLVVEERLYLFVSLLFLLRKQYRKYFIYLLAIVNFAYIVHHTIGQQQWLRYLNGAPVFYGLIFLNAGIVYLLPGNLFNTKRWILFITLVGAVTVSLIFPELNFLQVILMPLLVITLAQFRGFTNRAGKWGDFTYGIYIFSFPVQQLIVHFSKEVPGPYELFVKTLAIVLPLAVISWHLVEKQCLKWKPLVR